MDYISNYDIDFDSSYGDLNIYQQDVPLINNYRKYILEYTKMKVKTSYNEIFNNPSYGANLQSFIGKGINSTLIQQIKLAISNCLTEEGVITLSDFEVIATQIKHTVYIRIVFNNLDTTTSVNIQITEEEVEVD